MAIETSIAARQAGTTVLGGSVAGTLKYAPPEQMGELRGVRPGPYSDVYAFGKLCSYALFRTTEPTHRQWAAIPEDLADVLDRCVERELEHRHADFGPVLEVLESLASAGGGRNGLTTRTLRRPTAPATHTRPSHRRSGLTHAPALTGSPPCRVRPGLARRVATAPCRRRTRRRRG